MMRSCDCFCCRLANLLEAGEVTLTYEFGHPKIRLTAKGLRRRALIESVEVDYMAATPA